VHFLTFKKSAATRCVLAYKYEICNVRRRQQRSDNVLEQELSAAAAAAAAAGRQWCADCENSTMREGN